MAKQKNTVPVAEQKVEVVATTTETTQEVVAAEATETTTETVEAVVEAPETNTETTEMVVTDEQAPKNTTETVEAVVEAPEGAAKSDVVDFSAEAEKLMKAQYIKEIWRCPIKGYWFTKSDLASEHGKKVGKKPEHYTL